MLSRTKRIKHQFAVPLALFALLFSSALLSASCNRSSQTATTATPTPATQFERDLQYARNGQYMLIYVFSRQDGAEFTREDIDYLKSNSPPEVNMWLKSDEGRRVIAGSNFTFQPEQLNALTKRFKVDDYTGR